MCCGGNHSIWDGAGLTKYTERNLLGTFGDIEQYLQESGRAGRDGLPAAAILYNVRLCGIQVAESMKLYCKTKDKWKAGYAFKLFL